MPYKTIPALLFTVLLMLAAAPALAQDSAAPPNIIIILCDDLGQGDPGCYNADSKIPTPHIDRLAAQGMRFTDAHTPSSVCTPTRYGVLTGRYCWRSRLKSGVLGGWSNTLIEEDRPTIASMLQTHGYTSAAIGKWHLGVNWCNASGEAFSNNAANRDAIDFSKPAARGPLALGFDHSYLIPASLDMAPYLWLVDDYALQAPTENTRGSRRRWDDGGGFWRGGPISPGFDFYGVVPTSTEASIAFIERVAMQQRAGEEAPFFLYLPMPAPHTPWMPTPEFQGDTEAGWYGDFVAQTDAALGRIMAALDRNGLADNTILIFTSDNGSHWPDAQIEQFDHDANNGWRGQKADIWEAGHRVPFIVRWPELVEPDTVSDQVVCLTDLYATIAQIVQHDLTQTEGEDSISFLPTLAQDDDAVGQREAIVHHSFRGTFAIRRGDWKLIVDNLGSGGFTEPRNLKPGDDGAPEGVGGQLYNLSSDPAEQHNIWAEQPEVVAELSALLEQYRASDRSR